MENPCNLEQLFYVELAAVAGVGIDDVETLTEFFNRPSLFNIFFRLSFMRGMRNRISAIFCDKDSKKTMLIKIRFPKIHIAFGPKDIPSSVAFGKDKPGTVGRASLFASGAEKSSSPELRYFSAPASSPRAYESSRGNRPVRDIKPHNILFIACAIKTIKFV